MKVLEDAPSLLSLGKLCDEHGYSYEWINVQKPHLIKNGIRIQSSTENFVPLVVPGSSTSSSSSLPSSISMTPSRQEIDHPTSSSSLSTSPTMTSSTVSSESVARQARGDLCGTDSYPAVVSHVERQERRDLCSSGTPEEQLLTKPNKNPKPTHNMDHDQERRRLVSSRHTGKAARVQRRSCWWQSSWTQRLACKFFSWTILRAHLATQWIQSCSCKTKNFSGNTKELAKVLGAKIGSLKSLTLTLPWSLAKLVKIFPGIIVRRHHTDPKQMGLLREQCAE